MDPNSEFALDQSFTALAVLSPAGKLIAQGRHRLELRSWCPPQLPLRDLLIIESRRQVASEDQLDPEAAGVALVDVLSVEPWPSAPGMYGWRLGNVRPITPKLSPLPARGGLYTICLSSLAETAVT
ncbi:ASCH domain-containing protein [Mitsuaria sp. WAJ17]|uniref:ASCH domain-containing protein n=1 Tax=Mitsuaria sp. WAJ17 TaxID=2761452 RepID=UPI00160300FB|nr:ASCH domain-containing protein [Mitsuaria sp. WAJ17]MBB2485900.1 ASCH domain-containing protein [Mitsuaria sp. WAJ17]